MLRNSFKFLFLALAVSLTVAPASAIGWNSDSSRAGLLGLGFAVTTLVGVMVYKYCFSSKNTQKQKPEQKTATLQEKFDFYNKIAERVHRKTEIGIFSVSDLVKEATRLGVVEVIEPIKTLFKFECQQKLKLDKETFNNGLVEQLEEIKLKLGLEMTFENLKKIADLSHKIDSQEFQQARENLKNTGTTDMQKNSCCS